jgi:hypothetical protein
VIALGFMALSFLPAPARAESILITLAGAPVANGPNWDWTYNIVLTGFSSLNSGLSLPGPDAWAPDFGEIYDFAGYQAGTLSFTAVAAGLANGDFTLSTPLFDTVAETAIFGPATGEVLDDHLGITNLKFEFNNAVAFTNTNAADLLLGTLKATSSFGAPAGLDTYIGTDTKPGGQSGKNSATVQVPVVPTPQTVWGGLVLFSVMGLVKARRLVGV